MNDEQITTNNKKNTFRFLEWKVYRDAQKLLKEIISLVRKLPPDIRYTLGNQIIKSALSIVLNIAEGSGRFTDKELSRFFDIALGSVNETVAGLDSLRLIDIITQEQFDYLFKGLESISRQLGGFKKQIRNKGL